MSNDIISGKWKQLVGQVKEMWGDLTDQDLEKVKGNKDELIGLIQEKYGLAKIEVEQKINKLLDKF